MGGTTIVGCLYDGGVVIAADTRATSGPIVADKNCEKLHYISPQIWCAGAGTAADTEFTTALISSNLELHSLSTGRKPRVATVMTMLKQHLFRYQGYIGAYLVVAGCDPTGAHLFTVHAHGSTDKLPYVTMGSGSLAAMSVFETQWQKTLSQCHSGRYLQRPGLRVKRRRLCHHAREDADAEELHHAECAREEDAGLQVPERNDGSIEREDH